MLKIKLTNHQAFRLKILLEDGELKEFLSEIFEPVYKKKEKILRNTKISDKEIGKAIGILNTIDAVLGLTDKILGKENNENGYKS